VTRLNVFFAVELAEAPSMFFPSRSILRSQEVLERLIFFLPIRTTPEFQQATRFACLIKNKVSRIHSSSEIVMSVASKPTFSQPSLFSKTHTTAASARIIEKESAGSHVVSLAFQSLCFLSAFAWPCVCFFPCRILASPAPSPALASFVTVNDFALSLCTKNKHCGSIRIAILLSISLEQQKPAIRGLAKTHF
jgi:hypothetical protein